ncbi:MAG TPA: patatin-like phospholipase family protein [Nitrososphaeraceae archaeon]|nr:patatin-like phospholipase family protein [Nitrososphaeraceae archaeon]
MSKSDKTRPQRALVLQGGGALGAYEAGVFNVLYNWIKKDLNGSENIFDIVAGTSIGAINGAILVSHVKEKRSWEGSAHKLVEFWRDIKIDSNVEKDPFFTSRWQRYHRMNTNAASVEAARRYYSARQFILYGEDKVFSEPRPHLELRFFDPSSLFNKWYQYDNSKLRQLIKKKVDFPIGKSTDENSIQDYLH